MRSLDLYFSPVNSMRAILAVASALLVLTACVDTTLPPSERLGLVTVRAFDDGGRPVVRGSAVFYQAPGLQVFPAAPQECALFPYSPRPAENAGQTLDAGSAVAFTIGAFTESATSVIGAVYPVYNFSFGSYLNFVAGDSVLVSIPGAVGGYETVAFKARLAEPFTADALPTYVENTPMSISWQPATTPGSIMVFSLRYGSNASATEPNVEVACAFPDTGSALIPATFANVYGQAPAASQDHAFIRVRDRTVDFDTRTRTRVRSIFEYPTLALVDAP
jgi:hypothetical protein